MVKRLWELILLSFFEYYICSVMNVVDRQEMSCGTFWFVRKKGDRVKYSYVAGVGIATTPS
jgi:hypothetical protein